MSTANNDQRTMRGKIPETLVLIHMYFVVLFCTDVMAMSTFEWNEINEYPSIAEISSFYF
jgi:hypothetical protein